MSQIQSDIPNEDLAYFNADNNSALSYLCWAPDGSCLVMMEPYGLVHRLKIDPKLIKIDPSSRLFRFVSSLAELTVYEIVRQHVGMEKIR